eukprot:6455285-Amphidinium_carterae.1
MGFYFGKHQFSEDNRLHWLFGLDVSLCELVSEVASFLLLAQMTVKTDFLLWVSLSASQLQCTLTMQGSHAETPELSEI